MSIPVLKFRDENGNVIDVVAIRGLSAYHTALKYGFVGTEQEWYESLFGLVDNEMSDTSTNAVQNKVIKAYIDGLIGDVESAMASIDSLLTSTPNSDTSD